jgi:hypothetical protein
MNFLLDKDEMGNDLHKARGALYDLQEDLDHQVTERKRFMGSMFKMKMLIDASADCLPNNVLDPKVMDSSNIQANDGANFPFCIEHEKTL